MQKLKKHPSLWLPIYGQFQKKIVYMSFLGMLWSLAIFMLDFHSKTFFPILLGVPRSFVAIYSFLACLHSFYIFLSLFLSHFLGSYRWMQVATLTGAIPGTSFLFGFPQVFFALDIFLKLRQEHWKQFFLWRLKTKR